ncbi:MAG: NuoM family protein [Oligoflexales bacterium]
MDWINNHIITISITIALITSLLCIAAPSSFIALRISLVGSAACFFSALHIWYHYQASLGSIQFNESYEWIGLFGISYQVGVDGLNLLFIVLSTFLTPIVILSLWDKQIKNKKILLSLVMFLEASILGALAALDLFFFYFCWEVMIIPVYLIIGFWGGKKRFQTSKKLILCNACGSIFMFVGIIALYIKHTGEFGFYSASLIDLLKINSLDLSTQKWLFAAFTFAFAVRIPVWPLHTWLVSAYSQAPFFGSIILSGVVLKIACYGFLRFVIPLFPEAFTFFAPSTLILAIIGFIFVALAAWKQEDIKKLVAYASISHLSLAFVGCVLINGCDMSPEALMGAVYRIISHGISFSALFIILSNLYGKKLSSKTNSCEKSQRLNRYLKVAVMLITLDCMGIPGTGGFISQFLILKEIYTSSGVTGTFISLGVLASAAHMFKIYKKLLNSKNQAHTNLVELSIREKLLSMSLICIALAMGIYPELIFSKVRPTIEHFANNYQTYLLRTENELTRVPKHIKMDIYTSLIKGEK